MSGPSRIHHVRRSWGWASTCSTTCASTGWPTPAPSAARWEFLFVVAPLQIGGGTGSPVNPIAIL